MDNKNMPPKTDEKTKVIPVNQPASNQQAVAKPATPSGASLSAAVKAHQPNAFASYFKKGNTKAKRTIMAGAIGGGLLVSFLALTSFKKKSEDEVVTETPGSSTASSEEPIIEEGEVVTINTGHEVYTVVHDELSLEEAREVAREDIGPEGLFMHKSELHLARTNDEWNGLPEEEKLEYINSINVTPPPEDDVVTIPVDVNGVMTDLKMDPLHRGDLWQFGYDDSGHSFLIPQGRPAVALHNISRGEDGIYYRTDPVTNEMKVFSMEEIFEQIDQKGTVEVEVLVPGIDEPVVEGTYMYGYVDGVSLSGTPDDPTDYDLTGPIYGYGWGWDTDGDGDIDKLDSEVTDEPDPALMPEEIVTEPAMVTVDENIQSGNIESPKTDQELLQERIAEIAKNEGIDDLKKIKIHKNDDGSYDVKMKDHDGDKVKTTISLEDLQSGLTEPVEGEVLDTVDTNEVVTGEVITNPEDPDFIVETTDLIPEPVNTDIIDPNDSFTDDNSSEPAVYTQNDPNDLS